MDLTVYETGNGGDVKFENGDLLVTDGLFNQPYLAIFGGNPEQTTTEASLEDASGLVERFDWWGNSVLFPGDEEKQFNSLFERRLFSETLTSQGRRKLEATLKSDLAFMKKLAEIDVEVLLRGHKTAVIKINMNQRTGLEEKEFIFLWNGTKLEEITSEVVGSGNPVEIANLATEGGDFLITEDGKFIEL